MKIARQVGQQAPDLHLGLFGFSVHYKTVVGDA
jgi:hypothetical protein